jgi:A/G-specific adenine glycosylase
MLQQTRVDTVVPYYERFLARFPDLPALADSDEQEVLRLWSGLGYYARARNLRRAAIQVVRDHGGRIPRDEAALARLPGVGRYTRGALRSIAFREPTAIVDGNIRRVLARLLAEPSLAEADQWRLARALVPEESPDQFNQSLMELGATVCTPRAPRCGACPVSRLCRGRAEGDPVRFPRARSRKPPRAMHALGGLLLLGAGARRRVLLVRRPSRGLLGGLFEVPTLEGSSPEELVAHLRDALGLEARVAERLRPVRHGFTHRALTLDLYRLELLGGRLRVPRDRARFVSRKELGRLPLSTLLRKVLARAGIPA